MSEPVIALKDAQFTWSRRGADRFSLTIADWRVGAGERVALVGPSGSGKTTLLNLLAGVNTVDTGVVQLIGQDLRTLSSARRDRHRADHVGLIFQMFNLVPYMSVVENVTLPLSFSAPRRRRAVEAGGARPGALRLLAALGIDTDAMARAAVSALSVGQQQRVAAARALIGGPAIVLADEPTSALDPESRENFLSLLFTEAERSGAAIVVVTHDAAVADRFDRAVSIDDIAQSTRGGGRAAA